MQLEEPSRLSLQRTSGPWLDMTPLRGEVEKAVHAYSLRLGNVDARIIITIEPTGGSSNEYAFFLAMRAGAIERPISQSTTMKLLVHPRELRFSVFAFPPKSSIPADSLWSLRVWLSHNGIDHRLFAEERLWIGRNPDFHAIHDAHMARFFSATSTSKTYKLPLGAGSLDVTGRWKFLGSSAYQLSMEYDSGGVGRTLFDNFRMRLHCPPQDVHFILYLIPIPSTPPGASHRMRVWIRVPSSLGDVSGSLTSIDAENSVCLRIWSSDEFKVGQALHFEALGRRMVMASPVGSVATFVSESEISVFGGDDRDDSTSAEQLLNHADTESS